MDTNNYGILLINLGTPSDPSVASVRRYLREFLSDPMVIQVPAILRWLLLRLIILPFRSKKSAKAYASIWLAEGSPLLVNSVKLRAQVAKSNRVALGMTYGKPSIATAIQELDGVENIAVLPMYPQYADSSTGAAIRKAQKYLKNSSANIRFIKSFYDHPSYIEAITNSIRPYLQQDYDYLLTSYHGLPEKQAGNYKNECIKTSELIADYLALARDEWGYSFQSRIGKISWIKPYTDEVLPKLYAAGVRKLLISCPSFVVDCLETLEEIGIRAKEQWLELGGESLQLIPCINAEPNWVTGVVSSFNQQL